MQIKWALQKGRCFGFFFVWKGIERFVKVALTNQHTQSWMSVCFWLGGKKIDKFRQSAAFIFTTSTERGDPNKLRAMSFFLLDVVSIHNFFLLGLLHLSRCNGFWGAINQEVTSDHSQNTYWHYKFHAQW